MAKTKFKKQVTIKENVSGTGQAVQKKLRMSTWIIHPFCNSATFKYILLTVHSPRRVTTPHFNNNMLTVPKENYLKKKA